MSADDPKRARSIAFQLVGDLARDHASTLELVSRAEDVETRLAEPLARARARFRKKTAPSLHGVFEEAVREKLIEPVRERVEHEREAEDREAVREDRGYRTADDRPRPKPLERPKKQPRKEREKLDPGLRYYRQTGTIFVGIGVLMTIAMGTIAVSSLWKERLVQRANTVFVPRACTIVESRDVRMKNILAFETVTNGKTYRHDRYSPDVAYGPGASWLPKGHAGCVCDPDDPSVCFLYAGRKEGRESIPWIYILLFPVMWLGMGFAMRRAKSVPDGD